MNMTVTSQTPPVAATPVATQEATKHANPAVIGLAGFALSTLLLQFHNVGWVAIGPVVGLAIAFGGMAQLIAGLQEAKTGNNFGYSAFTSYGAFWIAFSFIQIADATGLFPVTSADVGWFLVVWTIYTAIMTVGAMRISTGLGVLFITLLVGFVLLVIGHFGAPVFNVIAGYELMICAAIALYVMAHEIFRDLFGYDVLPVGQPMIR